MARIRVGIFKAQLSNPAQCCTIVGGGLAGSEAAYQLAKRGVFVRLYEMRPFKSSPAHGSGNFAELVCSNSLGADQPTSPAGILKAELRRLDSLIVKAAEHARVPAGRALAVDRDLFSSFITQEIENHPNIEIVREEVTDLPEGAAIIAVGPLMSGALAGRLREVVGEDYLSFFDAAAPIVTAESIDMDLAYRASRYGEGDDYVNCPLDRACYENFHRELTSAERIPLNEVDFRGDWEPVAPGKKNRLFFEGCLPVEVIGERGIDTLRFGPMRPVGLADPRTGREPYAVVQLRRDNADGSLYNLVGFQTNLRWPEQERVFCMIPGLENAEFVRKGVMHRNTFVCAPRVLDDFLRPKKDGTVFREDLFLAGQITGVEGYVESTACGLVAALNLFCLLADKPIPTWPCKTAIGSLLYYLRSAEPASFQPMNVNLGIFPKLEPILIGGKRKKQTKQERCLQYAERSLVSLEIFLRENFQ